ncbi:MAG: glycerol-3-phosphate 1-O-acyltransferase PlsY [Myxococcota bacterium]|nr:glycerol-3-phosphate 1-O-acyltransferase PlsY [Myxococcota bacterium]
MTHLVFLLAAFMLGGVPFGLILGLLGAGVDVRRQGSGNIGATNVARVLGWRWGGLTLLLDVAKGVLPMLLAGWWGPAWMVPVVGLVVVLGHCYSPYLDFQGGKGVATGAGVMLVISWKATLLALTCWALAYALSKRSSVGALTAIAAIQVGLWIFRPGFWAFGLLLGGLLLLRHRGNVQRLMAGTELSVR